MESDIGISWLMFVGSFQWRYLRWKSCPPKRNNIGYVGYFVSFWVRAGATDGAVGDAVVDATGDPAGDPASITAGVAALVWHEGV